MGIELRHLRYVVAAAEHGSFRRAAVALDIAESSISRRIRDLEDRIGVSLFIRHRSGVRLTDAGSEFLNTARTTLAQIDDAAVQVGRHGIGDAGRIRIGLAVSLSSRFLGGLLDSYRAAHVEVRLQFVEDEPSKLIASIRHHEIDVALLPGTPPIESCECAPLWREPAYVVLPEAHLLADQCEIRWEDLQGQEFLVSHVHPGPEIRNYIQRNLWTPGRPPAIDQHPVRKDVLMQLVAAGQGLTITCQATTTTAYPGVIYRRLIEGYFPFLAVWSPTNDNPACRRLLSMAKAMAQKAASGVLMLAFALC